MIRKWIAMMIPTVLLLSGCWDELNFKDIQAVTMVGIDGNPEEVTVYYAFPKIMDGKVEYQSLKSEGRTYADARNEVNNRATDAFDLSYLQTLLITEETAKHRIYDFLDHIYRVPRNRVTGYLALVQGELEDYLPSPESPNSFQKNNENMTRMFDTFDKYSLSTMYNLQQSGTILFDDAMDLSLPVLMIGESQQPELTGTGLFSGMEFTGEVLSIDEGRLLVMLKGEQGSILRMDYEIEREGKKTPIQIELISSKQKVEITGEKVDLKVRMEVEVEEFAEAAVYENVVQMDELGKQLAKLVQADIEKLTQKLQESKSDALGLGRKVRAFHPELWNKGDWTETFASLEINTQVELTVERTGLLD